MSSCLVDTISEELMFLLVDTNTEGMMSSCLKGFTFGGYQEGSLHVGRASCLVATMFEGLQV